MDALLLSQLDRPFYSISSAARAVRVNAQVIRLAIKGGFIRTKVLPGGRRRLIPVTELMNWIAKVGDENSLAIEHL